MSKELHDAEMAGQNVFRNDRTAASYWWSLQRDGVEFLREWDECACDDRAEFDASGHVHRIAEWPGNFVPVDGEPAFEASENFEPFTLVAEPMFLDHQSLPSGFSYDVMPGDVVIWGHRVRFNATGEHGGSETTQVVGVRHADGEELVTTIYASGKAFEHNSLDDAMAHSVTGNPHELNA